MQTWRNCQAAPGPSAAHVAINDSLQSNVQMPVRTHGIFHPEAPEDLYSDAPSAQTEAWREASRFAQRRNPEPYLD